MTQQVTPEAFFDSLSIAHKLDSFLDGFKLEEIHLFSYFSSFLYCYAGNSVATWQYQYIATDGYPFSSSIHEAIMRHIQNGLFEERGEYFVISSRGTDEFNRFKTLGSFQTREGIINAACTTTILIPYSQAIRALLNDPEIKKEHELNNKQWLDQMSFYPRLKEISEAVGVSGHDLIIPAVTWINYLTETNNLKA